MTAIANLPDLRPSLLLDFANSGRVDPSIQCTRASSATCFGPDGKLRTVAANVPRIDYDPATGKCLGLLLEEGRTNMLINSVFSGASAGTPGTAPTSFGFGVAGGTTEVVSLGTNSAVRLKSATAARHFLTQTNIPVAVGSYCFSVNCYFYIASRVVDAITVLAGSAVVTLRYFVDGVEVTANTQIEVGRRKLTVQFDVTTAGNVAPRFGVGVATASVGDVEMGLPQLEAGAFPTSYIPTEASAVARAADQVFIEGLAFTGAMSFVQGAVLCSYTARSATGNQIVLQARSASTNLGFAFQFTSARGARNRALIDEGSGSPPNFSTRSVEAGVKYRAGLSWAPGTASNVVSGGFISTVTQPINISTPQRLGLGHNGFGAHYFNGHIHDLSLYAGYIQPAQLQRLTA